MEIYCLNAKDNADRIDKYSKYLSADELKRAKAFRFTKDRNLFAAGKIMTRLIVSKRLDIDPAVLDFGKTEYDRPFAKGAPSGFDFNLSHSGHYAVLALGRGRVGIDIEIIKPVEADLAQSCFHDREIAQLPVGQSSYLDEFFRFWTLKESFIKAVGQGLSYPLKDFYFLLEDGRARLNIVKGNDAGQWQFRTYSVDPAYKLAVCANVDNLPKKIIKFSL